MEGRAGRDHLGVEETLAGVAELELRAAALDVPALVLLPVELEAQRMAAADEEDLPDIRVGVSPDELPAPRLLDPARPERPAVETLEVGRIHAHSDLLSGRHSG